MGECVDEGGPGCHVMEEERRQRGMTGIRDAIRPEQGLCCSLLMEGTIPGRFLGIPWH